MIDFLQRNAIRIVLAGLAVAFGVDLADRFLGLPAALTRLDLVGIAMVVLGLVMAFVLPGRDRHGPPITVTSPVLGRWVAINSPASKVPSHGIRAYGQAFAVDLVHDPQERPRPAFGTGSGMADPADYPAFGEPVHAMIDGTVVRVRDRQRDHRTRTRWWAVAVMICEGALRELRGSDGVVGNHVVIDRGDGVFALVAHLKKGSAVVRPGDRVSAGDVIGACGNTGNTSEPHVHAQLMDRARPSPARGLPMEFADVVIGGVRKTGMPVNDQHLVG